MDFSINKKKELNQENNEDINFDPFSDYEVKEQDFENEIAKKEVAPVQSPVVQAVEKEENLNPFSDEFYAIENDEGNIPAPKEVATDFNKQVVQQNIAEVNNKLRFGKSVSNVDDSKEKAKANISKVNSLFRDTNSQNTQDSVTAEMFAEAEKSSSIFQNMNSQEAPKTARVNPFGNKSKGAVKPTIAQVEPTPEAPQEVAEADQVQPGVVNAAMMREAGVSSSVFQEILEKEKQPQKVEPDFVVESNVEKWSTIAKTDDRINPNGMHKHMAEKENNIHEEMSHGKASVDFFDNRKPEKLNNYYEHSANGALSHLTTKTGNQLREESQGKSNEKELNDAAYGNSKMFMQTKHKSELEFTEKFNPEAVSMVDKKQSFEKIDFNLRDKANNNRLGMETISNTNASVEAKKSVKLNPISAEEKLEWLNAYKEFDKERKIYKGETITDNKESRIANKLESNFEKNYFKMMEKSNDKDYNFGNKEVKPAYEHNKGLKTTVSDMEKERTQNSFRDFKSNELGETWKHELKDKSIGSATTVRPNDPFQEKKPENKINLNNVKQPAKFKDYSPELQAIIMRADQKMQSEYGTKPLDVQFGEDSTGFQSGKAKSMKQIWAETSQKQQATKVANQEIGGSAEMQAIKSVQSKPEVTDDKKQILGNMNNMRDKMFSENQMPDIVEEKRKKQLNQETGIGL
ncbi:MAG: hypothetical protein K2W92_02610 [Alphaproteobacteria bacterium]|nr:hypothetical protein [Alphaproteobacteria bacterium]